MRALRLHLGIWCLASVGLATVMLQEVSSSHSRPLRLQELVEVRGTGPCYWNQNWNCVPQPSSCAASVCAVDAVCNPQEQGYNTPTQSGTTVIIQSSGLDGTGFSTTVYCGQMFNCDCVFDGDDWYCVKELDLGFVQPRTQVQASGSWCGGSGS